jgi:hypothetical protein
MSAAHGIDRARGQAAPGLVLSPLTHDPPIEQSGEAILRDQQLPILQSCSCFLSSFPVNDLDVISVQHPV